jgi:hypothetical protein
MQGAFFTPSMLAGRMIKLSEQNASDEHSLKGQSFDPGLLRYSATQRKDWKKSDIVSQSR